MHKDQWTFSVSEIEEFERNKLWNYILESLREEEEDIKNRLLITPEEDLRMLQGAARALKSAPLILADLKAEIMENEEKGNE